MNKHTLGFVVLGCVASACASKAGTSESTETTTPSSETKYEVVIARPATVGQRLRVDLKATESVDALAVDDPNTEIDIEGVTAERQVTVTGVLEVVEVDEIGQVTRAEMEVERFYDDLGQREVLAPGAKVLATRDGDDFAVVVDGNLPSEDLVGWLQLAFPQGRPGGMLVGSALAPSEPKAVGETWEVAKDQVVSDLVDDGYQTTETQVRGEVTLVGTSECGSGECLELSGQLQAEEATLTEAWDATTLEAGIVEGKARLLVPTDTQRPVFLEDGESKAMFVAKLRDEVNGEEAQARIQVVRRRVATYVPAS